MPQTTMKSDTDDHEKWHMIMNSDTDNQEQWPIKNSDTDDQRGCHKWKAKRQKGELEREKG